MSPSLDYKPIETLERNCFFSAYWLFLDTLLSAIHIVFNLILITLPPDQFYG